MKIPLTRYGFPQLIVYPILVFALMLGLFVIFAPSPLLFSIELVLFLLLCWLFSFFRDPKRSIIRDESVLYSPADATITEIAVVDDPGLGEKALKISMFLSIFNVHVNRMPCSVRIEKVVYREGKFLNAMAPDSSRLNESNDVFMLRLSKPFDRLLVRQITGAIARRIVCEAKANDEFHQGEPYGMMKFGSRAELYLPHGKDAKYEVTVKIGDPVRAGLSPLVRYKNEN